MTKPRVVDGRPRGWYVGDWLTACFDPYTVKRCETCVSQRSTVKKEHVLSLQQQSCSV